MTRLFRSSLFATYLGGVLACSVVSSEGARGSAELATETDGGTSDGGVEAVPCAPSCHDPFKAIFDSVDKTSIEKLLNDATGGNPVIVNGASVRLTERWSPGAKKTFREFWKSYFEGLGATVKELTFPIKNLVGETTGTNVEAVLPGKSADSVVIIVHYDSVGIDGKEAENPGVDDDGSGLAMQMEAARIFSKLQNRQNTVRFVAADYEEISDNLDGDVAYVNYLQKEAQEKGFKILVASDDDQTGWSCWDEDPKLCGKNPPAPNSTFHMISCSGDKLNYDYPDLAKGFVDVATKYSTMKVDLSCDGSGDTDHYPFWTVGIPGYVIEEYGDNPHYDDTGNDTIKTINMDYLFRISQIQITYQAVLMGFANP